jgi:hypothetical protein
MIIHHSNYKNIDFKKYKRVFIFGCSFTYYCWPTWANVLTYECKEDTEIYNFGRAGGGNLFISERVIAANQKYRFTSDDLVLLMWSTHCREDRYIATGWELPGNIWTQSFYDSSFVKKYACVKGYIVRDLALMTMIRNTLTLLPCESVVLKSVEPDYDRNFYDGDSSFDEVIDLYRDMIDEMPAPLYESVKTGTGGWINGHHYHWASIKDSSPTNLFPDYHPNPEMYLGYLTDIGFNLNVNTVEKTYRYTQELHRLNERTLIEKWSNELFDSNPNYHWRIHLI